MDVQRVFVHGIAGSSSRRRLNIAPPEQANLLYANEHQHSIGIDDWTEEDNLEWRRTYAPPILKKLKAALQKVVVFLEELTDVINRVAAMGACAASRHAAAECRS